MPLKYPDILEHNNSNFALVDITELRGSSYPLGNLSETGSIPTDKRNVGAVVFVSSSQEFYGFYGQSTSDWDTTSNWKLISDVSGSATAPGADTQILYNSGGVISADSGLVYSGSRVGIGDTSPATTLTINHNGGTDYSQINTDFDMALGIAANTSLISGLDFKNFDSAGQVRLMARADDDTYMSMNQPGTSVSGDWFGITKSEGSFFLGSQPTSSARKTVLGSVGNADLVLGTNNTERIRVKNSGRVGIGTSTPTQTLDVSGSVIIRPSSTSATISFLNLGSAQSRLDTSNNFAIWTGGSEAMRLLSTGEIGIGTSVPSERLTVQGNISGSGDAYIAGNVGIGTTLPTAKLDIARDQEDLFKIQGETGNKPILHVSSSGQIWSGVATPFSNDLFTIRKDQNGSTTLRVQNATNGTSSRSQISAGTAGSAISLSSYLSNYSNARFAGKGAILTDSGVNGIAMYSTTGSIDISAKYFTNSNQLVVADNGNVGIGTATPSYTLEVNGTTRSSYYRVGSSGNILFEGNAWVQTNNNSFILDADVNANGAGFINLRTSNVTRAQVNNSGLDITGDLTVTGKITAQEFHTEFVSSSIIYESGSTKFGDSSDDVHQFTGSIELQVSESNKGFRLETAAGIPVFSVLNNNSNTFPVGIMTINYGTSSGGQISGNSNTLKIRGGNNTTGRILLTNGNAGNDEIARFDEKGLSVINSITSSQLIVSSSGTAVATIQGSGSAQPIFKVQGSVGELFAITDSLSGSLFSVNDITGLPILEVFSDNTINLGDYQAPALFTTAEVITDNSGSFTVYNIPTASYDGAFYEYTLKSGSNARAGNIMAIWSGTSVNFTETTTTDFGDTTGVSLNVSISGSNMVLTGSFDAADWHLKTIIKSI